MDCCKCCLLDAIGGGEQKVHLQAIVAKDWADWHVRTIGDVTRDPRDGAHNGAVLHRGVSQDMNLKGWPPIATTCNCSADIYMR